MWRQMLAAAALRGILVFLPLVASGPVTSFAAPEDPAQIATFNMTGAVRSVAFAPASLGSSGDSRIAIGGDQQVIFWDVDRKQERLLDGDGKVDTVVAQVAFSPDGELLAACTATNVVLWRAESGNKLASIPVPSPTGVSGQFRGIAFSPDSRTLAIAHCPFQGAAVLGVAKAGDPEVILWNIASQQRTTALALQSPVDELSQLSFSPDGQWLAVGKRINQAEKSTAAVDLWRFVDGKPDRIVATIDDVQDSVRKIGAWVAPEGSAGRSMLVVDDIYAPVAFSPDGKILAAGRKLLDPQNPTANVQPYPGPLEMICNVAFAPLRPANELAPLVLDRAPATIGLAAGSLVTVGRDLEIREAATGRRLASHRIQRDPATELFGACDLLCVDVSASGTRIVTGGADHVVRVWQASALGTPQSVPEAAPGEAADPANFLVAELPHQKRQAKRPADALAAVSAALKRGRGLQFATFSDDGKLIGTYGDDATARVWEAPTGRALRSYDTAGNDFRGLYRAKSLNDDTIDELLEAQDLVKVLFTAGEELLLLDFRQAAAIYHAQGPKVDFITEEDDSNFECYATLFGGATLALGVNNGSPGNAAADAKQPPPFEVVVWNTRSGAATTTLVPTTINLLGAIAFAPDSSAVAMLGQATGGGESVRRIEFRGLGRQRLLGSIDVIADPYDEYLLAISPDCDLASVGRTTYDLVTGQALATRQPGHAVKCLAFAPDGSWLATGHADNHVRIWDARAGTKLAAFRAHGGALAAIDVSPDGKLLVTGGEDNVARLWDLAKILAQHPGDPYVEKLANLPLAAEAWSLGDQWSEAALTPSTAFEQTYYKSCVAVSQDSAKKLGVVLPAMPNQDDIGTRMKFISTEGQAFEGLIAKQHGAVQAALFDAGAQLRVIGALYQPTNEKLIADCLPLIPKLAGSLGLPDGCWKPVVKVLEDKRPRDEFLAALDALRSEIGEYVKPLASD